MLEILKKSSRPVPMVAFTLASVLPAAFLAIGAAQGGFWLWAAVLYMAVFTVALDQVLPFRTADAPEGQEILSADNLLVGLGAAALVLMLIATWAIAGGSSSLSFIDRLLMLVGTGLWLGQVAHPAAHELIHRTNKPMFHLGEAVYSAMLIGHHASAHRLVHHRHVASDEDPNSAREGESFYSYVQRAWKGSFAAGLKAENEMRARSAGGGLTDPHPYILYIGGAVLALILAMWIAGFFGLVVWLLLAAHAQVQIFLSDYVQHYGLRRGADAGGRVAPVGLEHSWNSAHWLTSAMSLNAPRHSDHHMNPARPYPLLRLPETAPLLPWPLPVACTLALFPTTWKQRMQPQLDRWRAAQGAQRAAPEVLPPEEPEAPGPTDHDEVTPS